jgi:uncharacterized protein
MTRRLSIAWPDRRVFAGRGDTPIRLLAVSDEVDPALEHQVNRDRIGRIDAVVGCGDLEPSYLGFLADAFGVPMAYVRGNHDRGGHWAATSAHAPSPLPSGRLVEIAGLTVVPLEWPGIDNDRVLRDEWQARIHVLRAEWALLWRRGRGRADPVLVISHGAPFGVGDAADAYHVGFRAYRWFLERHRPPVWLHGHTTTASVADWRASLGPSTVANVTGSVIVELVPPTAEASESEP